MTEETFEKISGLVVDAVVRFAELLALAVFFQAASKLTESALIHALAIILYLFTIGFACSRIGYGAGYVAVSLGSNAREWKVMASAIVVAAPIAVILNVAVYNAISDLAIAANV